MVEIDAYVIMNLLAAVTLVMVAGFQLKKAGLSVIQILISSALLIGLFFVGSRLLYGLLYPQRIIDEPSKLFEFKLVNFSLYGGLFMSLLGWILLVKHYKLPFKALSDHIVPALGIAVALSKLGCFFNGCCYGVQTMMPWGVIFSRADQTPLTKAFGNNAFLKAISGSVSVPRHPTQLYEVFFALFAAGVAYWLLSRSNSKKEIKAGIPTLAFVILFTCGRWISFALRDFPNATSASNIIRGPVIYGSVLIVACLWIRRIIRA